MSEAFIQMLADLGHFLSLRIKETESIDLDNHIESRHFRLGKVFPYDIVHEQHFSFRVIHEVMDITRLELVKNRHRNRTVCQCSEEADTPVGLVSRTNGYLVTLYQTALLESDMKFGNTPCDVPVGQILTLVVRQCRTIPVFPETLFKEFVY